MTTTLYVAPADGRVVPDPQRGDDLPLEGRTVPRTPYWMRRLQDGDVTEQDASTKTDKPAKGGE